MSGKVSVGNESENVKVAVRVRPLNKKEIRDGIPNITTIDTENNVISLIKPGFPEEMRKSLQFDYIFPMECTQMDVYRHIAEPIVRKVLEGYNGTIFTYGQTGSGKTHTMIGQYDDIEQKGIIPNAVCHIFDELSSCDKNKSASVAVSYLEIYNEDVRDLLSSNPNAKLKVRERYDIGVYVKDLSTFTVDTVEDVDQLMKKGNANRFTRSTLMNDLSSRSHAIFTMIIKSEDKTTNKITLGKLNLVDLAGSERLGRTRAKGDRLKEANNINQSLSALGIVISALINKNTHIPYRNSKLTRLLQDSLGGNSKTAMIAMISPSEDDYDESICTLRYVSEVKYIQNEIRINVKTKKNRIAAMEQEINRLGLTIASLLEDRRNEDKVELQAPDLLNAEKHIEISDDESEFDFKPTDDASSDAEPATKRFCEFLDVETPEKAPPEDEKLESAVGESNSSPSPKMKKYSSAPSLKIVQSDTLQKSRSLTCVNTENSKIDFDEITSIRLELEKLQNILEPDGVEETANDECMDTESPLRIELNNEIIYLKDVCAKYVDELREWESLYNSLSAEKEMLLQTNASLEKYHVSRYNSLSEYNNVAMRRIDELENEKHVLATHLQDLEGKLDNQQGYLNEEYRQNTELSEVIRSLHDNIAELSNQVEMKNEDIAKYLCEAELTKHREEKLHRLLDDKVMTILHLENEIQRIEKEKEDEVQYLTANLKKAEDQVALDEIRVKDLEYSVNNSNAQNNKLSTENKNYQRELLKLKNAQIDIQRHADQAEQKLHSFMSANRQLWSEHNQLSSDFDKKVAIEAELTRKLSANETRIHENLAIRKGLEQHIGLLQKELQTLQADQVQHKLWIENLQKDNQIKDMALKEKEQELNQLRSRLGEFQAELEKMRRDFERSASNCDCKLKSARTSLSNKRRLEKNVLQDFKRNLANDETSCASQGVQCDRREAERLQKDHDSAPTGNEDELFQKYQLLKVILRRRQARIVELEKQLKPGMKEDS